MPASSLIRRFRVSAGFACLVTCAAVSLTGAEVRAADAAAPGAAPAAGAVTPPAGFTALFNGTDLTGWWGMGTEDPRPILAMAPDAFAKKRDKSLEDIKKHWRAENAELINDGHGLYLTTDKNYGDFELLLEYKTVPLADSGIYLRGVPQVQIWDTTEKGKFGIGANKGSGGLWNNPGGTPGKDPMVLADKPFGEWNAFRIVMIGERVSVWLNGKHIVDGAKFYNYFAPKKRKEGDKEVAIPPSQWLPVLAAGPIQLQTHGGEIRWRNVFIREIPPAEADAYLAGRDGEGFESVFNGKDLDGWAGPVDSYEVVDGAIRCKAGKGGVLHTKKTYADFKAKLHFQLPPGGNNGLAIRYPGKGDTAYQGMTELQVLDSEHPKYAKLDVRQYHGSAYGMAAAHRGYLRPAGQWNYQEVVVQGSKITVELNGFTILDADLSKITDYMAKSPHPGKDNAEGHFGFAGHSDPVSFKNVFIKELKKAAPVAPAPAAGGAPAPAPAPAK